MTEISQGVAAQRAGFGDLLTAAKPRQHVAAGVSPQIRVTHHDLSREAATEGLMGSFTQLNYHVVFSTKYRQPSIRESLQDRLYDYLGGTIRGRKAKPSESVGREITSTS